MVRPLPGFALCGGGAVTHYWYGMLIWALEPTTKPDPITELDQSFTGRSVFGTNKNDNSSITAYAMGIKFIPTTGPRPGEQCDIPIPVTDTTSDVTLNPAALPASNVMDGNLNTKWMSKVTQNPSIRLSLRDRKPVCKVDIAWGEGNVRKYKFIIELSTDNQNWLQGASGQSTGNTTAYESYAVTPTPAQYIRITVTDSALGTSSAQAQILEVKVFSDH